MRKSSTCQTSVGMQISELKRLNHLIQDQDFFGLKYVKVPIRKHGIMSETLDHKNIRSHGQASGASYNGASYNGDENYNDKEPLLSMEESDSAHDFSDPDMQMKIIRTLSIKDNFSSQGKEAEEFLKSMDKDLEKVRNSSRGERGSLNEVISVLGNKTIFPLHAKRQPEHLNGADCGIRWWSILLIIFFVVIVLPLGYTYWAAQVTCYSKQRVLHCAI
ncbi:hypothetical protein LOTGIDRAFT_230734 [Lottia gigantea]|uniref:LysM domain-containing protein n=1 Tax=Lottia gigantea TaxID=225164 RepID=V4ATA0_LOTGI|nr:hypothetical protein LOTGIDRAFT_230734 [Lottia gigantea]ESP00503.1 hypothetical protein LOTGIDRAFT_230734 [Lottia gigantea]